MNAYILHEVCYELVQNGTKVWKRNLSLASLLGLLQNLIWEFPKIGGTLVWGPYNKDPTIWGTILGPPIFGKSHIGVHAL